MSIKINCDQKTTTLSISISPRCSMTRKRLKSRNHLSEFFENIMKIKPIVSQQQKIHNSNDKIDEIINIKSIKINKQQIKMMKNTKILNLNPTKTIMFSLYYFILLILFNINHILKPTNALLNVGPTLLSNSEQQFGSSGIKTYGEGISSTNNAGNTHYLDNLDNLERSLAEVLIKVAYGTTSTTKRSIPDQNFVPSLTTVATPLLTTYRYFEKLPHQQPKNYYHRNYELDLERDHALPTSAPIADILKSNRNPTYPNPNRYYDRDRHRLNSTPAPSIHNFYKKGQPTIPMYSSDSLSFSRTPPLPREYENPFNDKPILRGTNSDSAILNNSGGGSGSSYINRRPIPPPSLMPGRERIPFRPPELSPQNDERGNDITETHGVATNSSTGQENNGQHQKKPLNTPTQKGFIDGQYNDEGLNNNNSTIDPTNDNENSNNMKNSGNFHIPNISRILSGSNGKKEDIPDVLFQQVITNQSEINENNNNDNNNINKFSNINQNKFIENSKSTNNDDDTIIKHSSKEDNNNNNNNTNVDDNKFNDEPKISSSSTSELPPNKDNKNGGNKSIIPEKELSNNNNEENIKNTIGKNVVGTSSSSSSATSTTTETTTWNIAWNIHIYLSVILFTILGVYFIFKIIFYNQLTHLFNQSYFLFIHLILIFICIIRIFYLIYDAYNINLTFNILISELLLNLPLILLLITFSILILYLTIRSLNIKNNRYSTLIRPLTILIGSIVLICLCITLHYVENYTTNNFYNQQQKLLNSNTNIFNSNINLSKTGLIIQSPPPRVLSLICQIIYIIACLILGLLYLYIYRLFKRLINSKTQNFINNNQNLSYAIHITIATALLFILLAIVQIFGTITITTKKTKLIIEIDWLQWGYQFSIRLIEITIIWLIGWVAGLKSSLHNEKSNNNDNINDNSNVSGFALFPCTSSSRSNHENFDPDYPNVCNVNINLHSYSKRTGKPLYNDNFTLNTIQNTTNLSGIVDYGTIDHYENPNFELRATKLTNHYPQQQENQIDNCYSEPLNLNESNNSIGGSINGRINQQHYDQGYGFQNFDRGHFQNRSNFQNRTNLRGSRNGAGIDYRYNNHHHSITTNKSKNIPEFDRSNFDNPERQSTNSRKIRVGGGMGNSRNCVIDNNNRNIGREFQQHQYVLPSDEDMILTTNNALTERTNLINNFNNDGTVTAATTMNCDGIQSSISSGGLVVPAVGAGSNDENANSASMLVADHGFVRFHPLNR